MRGDALNPADAAILRVIGEHGFTLVRGVSVAVGCAGRAILEAPRGFGVGGLGGFGAGHGVG